MGWSRHIAVAVLATSVLCLLADAATPGSFRGTIVEGDKGAPESGWLYVRSKNGSLRRVDISQAAVDYDETVPAAERKPSAREQLVIGAEVRVTAEQTNDGEWRASRIEIIHPAPARSTAGQPASGQSDAGVGSPCTSVPYTDV